MKQTIIIIEDDPNISQLIQIHLERESFSTLIFDNGLQGLEHILQYPPALVVLDRMLPGMEGLEVLKKIREKHSTPVIILSAKGDDVHKIIGLEFGADDYLSKPFHPQELLARIKAVLKRSHGDKSNVSSEKLFFKDLSLDPQNIQVFQGEETLSLSALEFKILHAMLQQSHKTWKREELSEIIHPNHEKFIYDRSIDAHIKNIRKKLGDSAKKPRYIQSVFGLGYRLNHEV